MSTGSEEVSSEQLGDTSLSPRKKVSIVWRYFEKLDRLRVRCKLCRHVQNYQGTTGNILRHLKNKHNIDATLKGQKINPARLDELLSDQMEFLSNEEPIIRPRAFKSRITSYNEELEDPYTETTILDDYMGNKEDKKSSSSSDDKRKHSIDEERIIAEIEYLREKTGYYRMQKNLTALQAKKIKYELGQLG